MTEPTWLSLAAPPLPYYLECGRSEFVAGDLHPSRRGLAVFDLLFVVEGALFMGEEERMWEVPAGHLLLLLPQRYHYPVKPCETRTVFYWIHFDGSGHWEEIAGDTLVDANRRPVSMPEWHAWFAPRSLSLPRSGPIPFPEETLRTVQQLADNSARGRFVQFWHDQQRFIELLQRLELASKAGRASQAWQVAERAEAFLKQHYAEEVTNGRLAGALHFHPNYITRCMKETFQCTPLEYLQRYRIEQAKLLLVKTDQRIAAVAERVGFPNTPYFSNCFRGRVGMTPLQFRKRFADSRES
jgi:AraC-like DNA-binding protein